MSWFSFFYAVADEPRDCMDLAEAIGIKQFWHVLAKEFGQV
jgi:hypothetical protein